MTAMVTATAKNRQTALMYPISTSTCGAKLDADSGYNGICDCTGLIGSLCGMRIAATENQNAGNDTENGSNATQTNDFQNERAVASGRRIILKAIQQQTIDGSADFAGGSIDETETQVARRILHAIKITGDAAIRC